MRRCMPLCFALLVLSACRGQETTKPPVTAPSTPVDMKFDGANNNGNPDFFFLPPIAADPTTSPNYDRGASNVSLTPSVDVCVLDVAAGTQAAMQASIGATTPCKGSPLFTATLGSGNVSHGILDDNDIDLLHFIATHYPSLTEPYYHIGWKVPVTAPLGSTAPPAFYRIVVRVGTKGLGFLDIESVNNFGQLFNVNTGAFVPLTGGLWLPINFRIENRALCANPGDKSQPCTSAAVNLSTGGTVQTVLDGTQPSGITIPAGNGTSTVNITVQPCDNFNPRVTDLPTFGACVKVTADPALPPGGFVSPATVFNCNVSDVALTEGPGGMVLNHQQADRVTLHQLDFVTNAVGGMTPVLKALPHGQACGVTAPVIGAATGTLRGLFAALRHGEVRTAAREAMALVSPKPLYAARFIDLGGGGLVGGGLSDFQFALPARFSVDPTTDNQLADAGGIVIPKVAVVDVDNQPVRGARVTFNALTGSVSPTPVATGEDGVATTNWTLSSTIAANSLTASGRGIAGSDVNGPRGAVYDANGQLISDNVIDPFQPIQTLFHPLPTDKAVITQTGSVTFSATALLPPIDGFSFGSGGYTYLLIGTNAPPSGWEKLVPTPVPTGWSVGSAPFGGGGYCQTTPAPVTNWPVGIDNSQFSDLLVLKRFSTRASGSFAINLLIDNDAQV
ncbi:MAG TPA: Ig-like domain-containing protein, partial [Gemmatimonadaceae bacterium]